MSLPLPFYTPTREFLRFFGVPSNSKICLRESGLASDDPNGAQNPLITAAHRVIEVEIAGLTVVLKDASKITGRPD
jgi:hypothetical protein